MARTKKQEKETATAIKEPKSRIESIEILAPKNEIKADSTWNEPERIKPKLTERQLRLLEVTERDVLNAKLGMAIEEQTLKNLTLQQSYLDLAIEKQKIILNGKSSEYENLKKRYATISQDVFMQHGFKGDQLSYDSETGDIVI